MIQIEVTISTNGRTELSMWESRAAGSTILRMLNCGVRPMVGEGLYVTHPDMIAGTNLEIVHISWARPDDKEGVHANVTIKKRP